ncbi:MAG: hypothetical protein JWP25_1435 [Bradyrhizobium sp.]|jgi:hypothetical protein|nr:hypothetical protein [Bradyrhizobium sp.]MEA3135221.1 hypothetical protein [Gammaproteobacteria bacterium]
MLSQRLMLKHEGWGQRVPKLLQRTDEQRDAPIGS